jgi:hypothetical protein
MFCPFESSSPSGRASPEEIETFWGWYPEYIQMQFDEQIATVENPFVSDSPADSHTNESSESSLDELGLHIHELLQTHSSNQEVTLLFDTASPPDSDEPLDRFGLPAMFDDLLAMPTPFNPQQDAVRRWLEYKIPPPPTSTDLTSPEPLFDANFSSFLRSPTLSDAEHASSIYSEDCESDKPSPSLSEYKADQSGHGNYSQDYASDSCFDPPAHVSCHSHDGVFHGDPNCACNCGSHCDFLRRNSKRFKCECDCLCHACFQSHDEAHSHGSTPRPRDSLDDHLESLDLAECGAVFTQPELGTT